MVFTTQRFPVHLCWPHCFMGEKAALSLTCVLQFSSRSLMTSLCSSADNGHWDAVRKIYRFSVSFFYMPVLDRGHEPSCVVQRWPKLIPSLCNGLMDLPFQCFPVKLFFGVGFLWFCWGQNFLLLCAAWKHPFNLKHKETSTNMFFYFFYLWLYCVTLYHGMVCVCTSF